MKFNEGFPQKEVCDEIKFSVFATVNYLSKFLDIETEKFLKIFEKVNSTIISLISTILFSSVLIIKDESNKTNIISIIIFFLLQ